MSHDRPPYYDTEPDVDVPTHAVPPSPTSTCCMCHAQGVELEWSEACEIRRADGYHYGAGWRCLERPACRTRRSAP